MLTPDGGWKRASVAVGAVAGALGATVVVGCNSKSGDHMPGATSDGNPTGDGSPGSSVPHDAPPDAPKVECNTIVAGLSTVKVYGNPRSFYVQMPSDTSRMALLFVWHGWLQDANQFAQTIVYDPAGSAWKPFDPNAFPMPLMIISPVDTKLIPPNGLDWDIASGSDDFPFFDAMLQCAHDQVTIDDDHVYSFGFSAGAVFSNLLAAHYPHLFAATISESGAWFNDQAEWSDVSVPIIAWQWPALNPADKGNVLLTHGGSNDYATVISLEDANHKAVPYLYQNGRTVMECAHTFGHTLDPDLTQHMYYEYLWDHTLGGSALTGPIADFPSVSHPVGATSCIFHPGP
jgi:predicted esterase